MVRFLIAAIAATPLVFSCLGSGALATSQTEVPATLYHGVEILYSADGPVIIDAGLELDYVDVVSLEDPCRVNCDSFAFVFGEVKNATETQYDFPDLAAVFLDKGGNVVGSATVFPLLITISPGKSVPFRADARRDEIPESDWEEVQIQLTGTWGTQFMQDRWAPRPITLEDVVELERSANTLRIEGKLRNNGDVPLSPYVSLLIFTSDGRFRGAMIPFDLNDEDIPPGRTVSFTVRSDYQPHEYLWYAGSNYVYEILVV